METALHLKSQTIVFDSRGCILESCNSLFNISKLVGKKIFEEFPLLAIMKKDLKNLEANGNPLFINKITFAFKEYKSICDFVFVKNKLPKEETFTWMINDNSIHFQHLIRKFSPGTRTRMVA